MGTKVAGLSGRLLNLRLGALIAYRASAGRVARRLLSEVGERSWLVMTVTTRGGAVYSIDYRDLDGAGKRLAVLRRGGPDDPPETNKPMAQDRWYRVAVLTPLPPEIGTKVQMVLDPVEGDSDPIVRFSTMVMSVVGVLE